VVVNLVDEVPADASVDGIAELWFDSREAFDAAYATDEGKAVLADTLAHVAARVRLLVSEHVVHDTTG
jgi:uncharacterized protein (TIGR02118 family)